MTSAPPPRKRLRLYSRLDARFDDRDEDPRASLVNLVDVMLVFACGLLAALARRASRALGVRPVDRGFGALFGLLRGGLLLLLATALVRLTPLHEQPWWRQSLSARWLEMALQQLPPFLPESFGKFLSA